MPHPFDIIVTRQGRAALLSLAGDLDVVSVPRLEEHLHAVEHMGLDPVVVDLRDLTFIDSSGLRAILLAHDRAAAEGRRLAVLHVSGPADRLLRLVGADDVLEIVAGLEALEHEAAPESGTPPSR